MLNSKPIRIDRELEDLFKDIARERVKRDIDVETIKPRRLSKAMARMIKRDIGLRETLIQSPLEDDRKFRRKK